MSHPLKQYCDERFPLGPYSLLVGAMVAAGTASTFDSQSIAIIAGWRQLYAFLVMMLVFFHLRVFDEDKDYEKDCIAHPERVLSRGLVTLEQLRTLAYICIVLELGVSALLGMHALYWIGAVILFSLAMRFEFGVSDWLNRHIVIYAFTHNPIVALMMMYVAVVVLEQTIFPETVLLFLVVASLTSLGFEIGRKIRAPEDEKDGQDTYTGALGVPRAVALLSIVLVAGFGAARILLQTMALQIVIDLTALGTLVTVFYFLFNQTAQAAKRVETASTLGALVVYILIVVDVSMRRGIIWS